MDERKNGVLTDEWIRGLIERYFEGCNAADADAIEACFTSDGVHYFPPGMYDGPWEGARYIAERWVQTVQKVGSVWTIDRMVTEPKTCQAVIEWTHFKTFEGTVLRGDEWYIFDPESGLIAEIRAYYASPQDKSLERLELGGYDYLGRGYALKPPFERQRGSGGVARGQADEARPDQPSIRADPPV